MVEIEKYLSDRKLQVNLDSFYRIRSHGLTRLQAKDILTAKGYVQRKGTKIFDYSPSSSSIPTSNFKLTFVTSYEIGQEVHDAFFKNLKLYAAHLNADIAVLPIRSKQDAIIDTRVLEYLQLNPYTVGSTLIDPTVRIGPNATVPLSGFETYSQTGHDLVLPHSHQTLKILPGFPEDRPVSMWTTGGCSIFNAPTTAAAKKTSFRRKLGFLIIDENCIRNVEASENGSFQDLLKFVSAGNIVDRPVAGVVWGDLHAGIEDPAAVSWAIRTSKELQTPQVILHDILDCITCNPHTTDLAQKFGKFKTISEELQYCRNLLRFIQSKVKCNLKISDSNHDDFLSRYFKSVRLVDIHPDDRSEYFTWIEGGHKLCITKDVPNVTHIPHDYLVANTVCGQHGNYGVGGSRGSQTQFSKWHRQIAVGHGHSAFSLGNAKGVGHLSLPNHGYNDGKLSTWCQSILSISIDNKSQHLIKFI